MISRDLELLLYFDMIKPNAISFADATTVRVLDSHAYEVNLEDDWCIGTGISIADSIYKQG